MSNLRPVLEFLRTPWVWFSLLGLVALGAGWLNLDELVWLAERIAGAVAGLVP